MKISLLDSTGVAESEKAAFNKLEEVLSEKTKAIVVVHLYGFSADITKISEICKKYNLFLIEDVSQAHGAQYKNKKLDVKKYAFPISV